MYVVMKANMMMENVCVSFLKFGFASKRVRKLKEGHDQMNHHSTAPPKACIQGFTIIILQFS